HEDDGRLGRLLRQGATGACEHRRGGEGNYSERLLHLDSPCGRDWPWSEHDVQVSRAHSSPGPARARRLRGPLNLQAMRGRRSEGGVYASWRGAPDLAAEWPDWPDRTEMKRSDDRSSSSVRKETEVNMQI